MIASFNTLGLDFVTFDNHEFYLIQSKLIARMNESKFTQISSNVFQNESDQPFSTSIRYKFLSIGEIKILLIDLTIDSNQPYVQIINNTLLSAFVKQFLQSLSDIKYDILTALTHLDLATDIQLAENIPEIDLIIGEHEHEDYYLLRGSQYVYTFLLHGVEFWTWTVDHSPLSAKHMERLKNAFQETCRGLLIGVGLTCAVQGLVATIAYLCLQIPRWYALGVLTGFCSLIPILGTAIVWIPITIGVFAIGSVDNLLRPVFSKLGSLQMSTLLLLLTIFGGLGLLGAWGALLGPLIVRLATEAIILVREDQDQEEQNETL